MDSFPNDDHDRLSSRLHTAVDGVSATADLVEVEHGARRLRARRRAGLGVAAAMLIAGAAGAGFGLGRAATDTDSQMGVPVAAAPVDDAASGEQPDAPATTEPPEETLSDESTAVPTTLVEPPTPGPLGPVDQPDTDATSTPSVDEVAGGWMEQYELVVDRRLESGHHLRVHRGPSYGGGAWGPDQGPRIVPSWSPEPWCHDESEGRVAIAGADIIDTGWFGYRHADSPVISVMPVAMGWADDAPVLVLIVQSTSATEASVVHELGSDSATAVDGVVALVLAGAAYDADYELTVITPDGPVEFAAGEGLVWDSPEWRESCEPPPPALPDPGEQPDDPAAAEAEVRANFDLLYDNSVPHEDKPLHLLDDWRGIDEAREAVAAGSYAQSAASAALTIEELVFTSPTEAAFRYRIDAETGTFTDRFGAANHVDGHWRIARETYCQDLSLAGGNCY